MIKDRLIKLSKIHFFSGIKDLYSDTIYTIAQIKIPENFNYEYRYDEQQDAFVVSKDSKNDGQDFVGNTFGPDTYAYQQLVEKGQGAGVDKAKAKQEQRKQQGTFKPVTLQDMQNRMQQVQQQRRQQQQAGQTQSTTPPQPGSPNTGTISDAGLMFIKKRESAGGRPDLKAYSDYGRFSIAFGNTYYPSGWKGLPNDRPTTPGGRTCGNRPCVQANDVINASEAEQIIRGVVRDFEVGVSGVIRVPISQQQFDALVSFAYNMGVGALQSSNLAKMINQNPNDPNIATEFLNYTKEGKVSKQAQQSLADRRKKEAGIYFYGKY